jgi:hypothetical protein
MALIGTCSTCGTRAPLIDFLVDAEARRAFSALCDRMADYPDLLRRIPGYLSLHSTTGRSAAWPKVTRLIDEISDLVSVGTVTYDRVTRPCPPALWAHAMDEAQESRAKGKLIVPLDGHGWVIKVAWAAAGKTEAQTESNRQALARGETPTGYSAAHTPQTLGQRTAAAEAQEIVSDLRALLRLEAVTPGVHTAGIARYRERLAALGILTGPGG